MKRMFDSLIRRPPKVDAPRPAKPLQQSELLNPDTYAYLPVEPTLLLRLFSGHISAIRQTFPSFDEFNGVPARLIADLANYLHLLPASFSHHHKDPGGAFRHALEVGCYAVRSAKPLTVTPHIGGRRRYDEEAQKCTVAFLLGALHDIGKPFNDYRIRSADSPTSLWAPNQSSLYDWASMHARSGYFVERVPNYNYRDHLVNLPVDSTHLASRHLSALGPEAYNMYRDALRYPDHPLWKAVESADRISCVRDTALSSTTENFLLQLTCDAMHHLISSSNEWTPNTLSSHLHLTSSFIYVSHPAGLGQLHAQMLTMDPRTPRSANTLLDALKLLGSAYSSPSNVSVHTLFINKGEVQKESVFICLAAHIAPELYEHFGATEILTNSPSKSASSSTPKAGELSSEVPKASNAPQSPINDTADVTDADGPHNGQTPSVGPAAIVANGKLPVKPRQRSTVPNARSDPTPVGRIIEDCAKGILKVGPIGQSSMDIVEGTLRMTVQDAVRYFPALPDASRVDNFLKAYALLHEPDGYIWPDDTIRLTTNATSAILENMHRSKNNG